MQINNYISPPVYASYYYVMNIIMSWCQSVMCHRLNFTDLIRFQLKGVSEASNFSRYVNRPLVLECWENKDSWEEHGCP